MVIINSRDGIYKSTNSEREVRKDYSLINTYLRVKGNRVMNAFGGTRTEQQQQKNLYYIKEAKARGSLRSKIWLTLENA